MNKISVYLIIVFLLTACKPKSENKYLTYQNIVILSDMSDRLDYLPNKDTIEIFKLVEYFKTECVKPGEKIGDKSCIKFAPFTSNNFASIDINEIKKLGDKQSFINSTEKFEKTGLDSKLKEFKHTVVSVYDTLRNPGLDLISLLINRIEDGSIIKENKVLSDGIDSTFINYSNHIYLFTDGYLEYFQKSVNAEFYFGLPEIDKIRQYCLFNNINLEEALAQNHSLGLPPYVNTMNKLINLHVLETHERDKNIILNTYKHPIGLRDNEILEAVWRMWATASDFKSFEWSKY